MRRATWAIVAMDADAVDAHVQERHAPEAAFFCEFCAAGFYTDVGLEAHKRNEHDQRTDLIKKQACDLCGKAFNFVHSLRKHKLCKHEEGSQMAEKEKRKRKSISGKCGRSKVIGSMHKTISLQTCRVCGKDIEYKRAFRYKVIDNSEMKRSERMTENGFNYEV